MQVGLFGSYFIFNFLSSGVCLCSRQVHFVCTHVKYVYFKYHIVEITLERKRAKETKNRKKHQDEGKEEEEVRMKDRYERIEEST